jgi:MFS family permease
LYPYLTEKYGSFYVYRLGCILSAFTMFLVPCISIFNHYNNTMLIWVSTVGALTAISSSSAFSLISVFVFINNSCYSHERGTVNGIGQTFAAFGRLLGPYFGSVTFAWSEVNGFQWPLNYFFVWYIMGTLSLLNYIISRFLPKQLQRRKREPKEPRYALSYQKDSG